MHRWALAIVLAGCGRFHFGALGDAGATTTDAVSDAAPDAALGTLRQTAYVKPSDTTNGEAFGTAVALSRDGTTLVVGAADVMANAGEVFVFVRGTAWTQQAILTASDAAPGTYFGGGVAISGDGTTIVVGSANAQGARGAAYVFTRTAAIWTQRAILTASNADPNDLFGGWLAIADDGMTIAIGADREASAATGIGGNQADNAAFFTGATYVFTGGGATWTQVAYIKASNTNNGDAFGRLALSADGRTLVVTAHNESSSATGVDGDQSDNSAANAGAAYVFVFDGASWSQEAYLKASNTDAGDTFGVAVAIDGSTIAIGAVDEQSAATGIDGDQGNGTSNAGAVYIFVRTGVTWSQQAYVKPSTTRPGMFFGAQLALGGNGSTLAAIATAESSSATGIDGDQADASTLNAGAAFLFSRSGTTWQQTAYIKASNTETNDMFGAAIALSRDASTLAITTISEDSGATGIDGNQADNSRGNSGAAYVFQ